MERFKDLVMKLSENAPPDLKNLIQEHLNNFTSGFHTPDHPPYAAMIHTAIIELNEKRGSSEESISEYIKNQHSDLPLAHNSLLKHHLGKLCDSGEIVVTGKHLYILPGSNPTLESHVRAEKDRVTRKRRAKKGRGRVGKKGRAETDKHGETHAGEHGETDRCYKGNDEIIGDSSKMKVDNKVNGVGELDQVVKQTDLENRMLDEQSQLHQQLSHSICAPVVDSKQPENLSPDRPPGFEFITFQSKHKDLMVQERELISNSERLSESDTLPQVDQEQCRLRGQPNCIYQNHSEDVSTELLPFQNHQQQMDLSSPDGLQGSKSVSLDVSTKLLPSQNQQQQMDPLNSDGLQGVKSEDVRLLELHQKNLKQYGRRKKLKFNTKAKEMQDVTAELQQKTKQLDLSSHPLSPECQKLEFCKEKQLLEFKQQVTLTYDDVDMDTKQQGTKKGDHVARRSQRVAKSTSPSSQSQCHHPGQSMLENIQSSLQVEVPQQKMEVDYVNLAHKLQRLQLPPVDNFHTTKHIEMGFSQSFSAQVQMSEQRAKLRSSRPEQVQQEPLCLDYEQPVALKELSMQQAHTKLLGTTELEGDTSKMDMPTSHQRRPQMHQGRGRGRGRPPRMKLGQRSMQNS